MNWKRIYKAVTHPSDLLVYIIHKTGITEGLDDERYLRLIYFIKFHRRLNLDNPTTYNEKLQWLKLHDHNPKYPIMVDKITAKDYVASIIGKEYIIPTLAVYDSVEDIRLEDLPEQFVLKTNHSGGNSGVVICSDRSSFDLEVAKKKLQHSLNTDMFPHSREWPYSQIKPRVFVEKYMSESNGLDPENSRNIGLNDYKFFCFDGEVKALFIGTERNTGDVKFDFYDANFNHLDIVQTHPMSGKAFEKPVNFEQMIIIAQALSKCIPHVRVDLYNIEGKIYFGEMTFYHHSGFYPFHPSHWDKDFGAWMKLEKI